MYNKNSNYSILNKIRNFSKKKNSYIMNLNGGRVINDELF